MDSKILLPFLVLACLHLGLCRTNHQTRSFSNTTVNGSTPLKRYKTFLPLSRLYSNVTVNNSSAKAAETSERMNYKDMQLGRVAVFTSPNYPAYYPPKAKVTRTYRSNEPNVVFRITCGVIFIPCNDYLRIIEDRVTTKFCGLGTSFSLTTRTSSIKLQFKAGKKVQNTGFSCNVEVVAASPPTQTCDCGLPNYSTRIAGGSETNPNEYPWQVGIIDDGYHICGGSVINHMFVITAAHCVVDENMAHYLIPYYDWVLFGDHDYKIDTPVDFGIYIDQVIVHPLYNPSTLDSDIALLRLSEYVDFGALNNFVAPICMPDAGNLYFYLMTVASGWGQDSPGGPGSTYLRDVVLVTLPNDVCKLMEVGQYLITDNMICAGVPFTGETTCPGDSGGPLAWQDPFTGRYDLVGITSWGAGCPKSPSVYTRVTEFLQWIETEASATYRC